ncbi:hypothetical protein [Streptomyces bluensis]|uniref:hypothetical protein n=1 Tax=Streptomyces bluensis TaxID=33897 RepID=UPI0016745180|nr:hypothetical protein [Streptomyces bluensis]GGZ88106.1 hypothetical protein GCM10010344_64550 [Streptomyces bluensis]
MTSAHTDPYRLTATDDSPGTQSPGTQSPGTQSPAVSRGDVVRTLLWTVLVISAAVNLMASYAAAGIWLNLASGLVTLLSAGTLVARKLRGRR